MANLYKLFYKDYFQSVDFSYLLSNINDDRRKEIVKGNERIIADHNKQILDCPLTYIPPCKRANVALELKVMYPGLITGSGINHEANIEGEFKLGIHLEYTSGMPVIYGSSIKGICRAAFKDADYIQKILKQRGIKAVDVEDLEKDIFDGLIYEPQGSDNLQGSKIYKLKSIYQRDIFFDAVIKAPDSEGRIVCSDYITPHYKDVLKDPVPLGFIKIAPGCTMEFRFRLIDSLISKEEKFDLLYTILHDFGVGAKSSVGYGYLK